MLLNSFDEWTELREVIVGTSIGLSEFHLDESFKIFYWSNLRDFLNSAEFDAEAKRQKTCAPFIKIDERIIEELNEDLLSFVETLQKTGIIVHRPLAPRGPSRVVSPYWITNQLPALNVRDQTIVFGNTVVETATHVRSRYFENDGLRPILKSFFDRGANWLAMPRSPLAVGGLNFSYFEKKEQITLQEIETHLRDETAARIPTEWEFVFDGAQCIRLGKDILVNVSNQDHDHGYQWLNRNLGNEFNFHRIDGMADTHIDSTIIPLRPGLLLLRSPQFVDFLPQWLQKWDVIYPPEPNTDNFPDYRGSSLAIASKFIDMNVLSLSERLVIVNSLYPELIREIERHGFDVIPVRHRHRRMFGGGFHCFTLDVVRSGQLECYR